MQELFRVFRGDSLKELHIIRSVEVHHLLLLRRVRTLHNNEDADSPKSNGEIRKLGSTSIER